MWKSFVEPKAAPVGSCPQCDGGKLAFVVYTITAERMFVSPRRVPCNECNGRGFIVPEVTQPTMDEVVELVLANLVKPRVHTTSDGGLLTAYMM